jgi:class 3 adenylate cyclase
MSDVEASNDHWSTHPAEMRRAVAELDAIVAAAVRAHRGTLLKARGEGDSHFAVFAVPSDAVMSAAAMQSRLMTPTGGLDLRARIAIHVGEVDDIESDYYGVAVNQTARLRALAHGGQTVVSGVAAALSAPSVGDRIILRSLGHHRIRDFPRLEEVFQASPPTGLRSFPPLRASDTHRPALMALAVVDICGSNETLSALNEHDVIGLQREWAVSIRALGELHNANAIKLLGDGCLAAFEDPLDCLAFTHDFRAELEANGLQIRAGVDVGRVELVDGEIIGMAVLRAHRLEREADRGEIVLGELIRELVEVSGCGESRGRRGSSPDRASVP